MKNCSDNSPEKLRDSLGAVQPNFNLRFFFQLYILCSDCICDSLIAVVVNLLKKFAALLWTFLFAVNTF